MKLHPRDVEMNSGTKGRGRRRGAGRTTHCLGVSEMNEWDGSWSEVDETEVKGMKGE